jgi:transposase
MRGIHTNQSSMFSYISAEERVPANHPLRKIKRHADKALDRMYDVFAKAYSDMGRPSIPPERLLKAQLLIALYTVRSDRQFCEMLDYNLLFRWFLDMSMDDAAFDHSTFSKNRERLMEEEVSHRFLQETVRIAREEGLLSQEHFTVDGTLIEAWASLKSFKPKKGSHSRPEDDDPGNPTINFHGEKRGNVTHQSTTDPEARLMRKSAGVAAVLSYCGNGLMENRNGICVDWLVAPATGKAEREAGEKMVRQTQRRSGGRIKSLGADKGYHTTGFVKALRGLGILPHIACKSNTHVEGLDGRTTRHDSYRISQRKRKRVEEIFGWLKTIGSVRKVKVKGTQLVQETTRMAVAAYNLVRIGHLTPLPGATG